jgi:hypothetical protein
LKSDEKTAGCVEAQRVILNFTPGPQGGNFTPRGELDPQG